MPARRFAFRRAKPKVPATQFKALLPQPRLEDDGQAESVSRQMQDHGVSDPVLYSTPEQSHFSAPPWNLSGSEKADVNLLESKEKVAMFSTPVQCHLVADPVLPRTLPQLNLLPISGTYAPLNTSVLNPIKDESKPRLLHSSFNFNTTLPQINQTLPQLIKRFRILQSRFRN